MADGDGIVLGTVNASSSQTFLQRGGNRTTAFAVFNANGDAINGSSGTDGDGVEGTSDSGSGLRGITNSGVGVDGYSGSGTGVRGSSAAGDGVVGISQGGSAVGVRGT